MQQFIAEYKKFPELVKVVMSQFGDDYQSAKSKMKERMVAAGLDPNILDSSDEESEAEDDPPPP